MPYLELRDGTLLSYKDWGNPKDPIVTFSHGWPLSSDNWENQMVFLAERGFRVIAHDRRGHGRSTQTWTGNNMDNFVDDLEEALAFFPRGLEDAAHDLDPRIVHEDVDRSVHLLRFVEPRERDLGVTEDHRDDGGVRGTDGAAEPGQRRGVGQHGLRAPRLGHEDLQRGPRHVGARTRHPRVLS